MDLAEKMQRVEQLQQLISAQEQQIQELLMARNETVNAAGPYRAETPRGEHAMSPSLYSNIETPHPGVPQWGADLGLKMPTEAPVPAIEKEMIDSHRDWQKNVAAVIEPGTDAGLIERLGAEIMMLGTAMPGAAWEASQGLEGLKQTAQGFAQFPLEAVSKASAISEGMAQNNPFTLMLKNLAPKQMEKLFEAVSNLRGKSLEVFNKGLGVLGLEIKHRTPGEAIEDIKRQPLTSAAETGMAYGGMRALGKLGKYVKPKGAPGETQAQTTKPVVPEISRKQVSFERSIAKWKQEMENPPGAARSKVQSFDPEGSQTPKGKIAPSVVDGIAVGDKVEPWRMTKAEYSESNWYRKRGGSHKMLVEDAISEGKIKSHAEYPKLKAKPKPPDALQEAQRPVDKATAKAQEVVSDFSTATERKQIGTIKDFLRTPEAQKQFGDVADVPVYVKPGLINETPGQARVFRPKSKNLKDYYIEVDPVVSTGTFEQVIGNVTHEATHIVRDQKGRSFEKGVAEVSADKAGQFFEEAQAPKAKALAKAQEVAPPSKTLTPEGKAKRPLPDKVVAQRKKAMATRAKKLLLPLRDELVELEAVLASGKLEKSPVQSKVLRTRVAKLKEKIRVHEDKIPGPQAKAQEVAPAKALTKEVKQPWDVTLYHGSRDATPSTLKIGKLSEGKADLRGHIEAAYLTRSEPVAAAYSRKGSITQWKPKPDAKVLHEGTPEFQQIRQSTAENLPKSDAYVTHMGRVANEAKKQGYDIVNFKNDRQLGVVVLNPDKVARLTKPAKPSKPKGEIVELEAGPSFIGRAIKRTAGDILEIGKKILISGEGRGKSKPYKGLVESMRRVNDTHGPVRDAFIEKLREGGVWKLRLNPKKSVELGKYLIEKRLPPKGHPLHEAGLGYRKAVHAAFGALRKSGVMIKTASGKLKPIFELHNFFPHRLKPKHKEAMFEEAATLVERAQADIPGAEMKGLARGIDAKTEAGTIATLNRLMTKYTPQHADFKAALEYRISTGLSKTKGKAVFDIFRMTGPDIYRRGALEHGRTLEFPMPMYDTDVVRVMSGYADELGRVVGEVKEWGPNRQKIVHQLADIAAESPKEGQTAIQMVKQFMGTAEGLSGATRKLAERYVNLAVARKIGLGTATIPNLFQTGISTVMLGYKPTLRGVGGLLTKTGRKQARLSSSPYGDFIRNYYGKDVSNVSLSRQAASFTTTANGFQMVNRFNKALGALTMRYKLPELHKWANLPVRKVAGKGKMGEILSRRAYGQSMLKKLGVDPAKPLTEDMIIKASHRFTTEAQLMKNVIHEPLWMTSPQWKPFSLFKSFIYKQLKFTKDYVIKEAHRNPMPLVRLIASGIGTGELIVQAKELLRETLTGEERKRKAQSLVERAAFDLAASATFGIATEVFDAFDPYETPGGQKRGTIENVLGKLAFLIQPILLDELFKLASMSKKAAVDVVDKGFTPKEAAMRQGKSAAYIMGSIPGGIYKGQMSKTVREMSIRKLLRDARRAKSEDIRKNKQAAAKGLQTRWNKEHPKDRISILSSGD